jgi:murein DD-endopeptidase MepM/ murein hydrolase activator NlpD
MFRSHIKILFALFTFIILLTSCNLNREKYSEVILKDSLDDAGILKKFNIQTRHYEVIEEQLKTGDSFSKILTDNGIVGLQLEKAILACDTFLDLNKLKVGDEYFVFKRKDSTHICDYMVYRRSARTYIKFDFRDSIQMQWIQLPERIDTLVRAGRIESSLWNAMSDKKMDPRLAIELADIYSWTIDFYELQKGDSFIVMYEKRYIEDAYVGLGKVLSCHFIHSGKNFTAYRYTQDESTQYFDAEGNSLRRAFLKAPLKYGRISSHFSNSRLHPVLKIRRPHHGVDYAAPTGTPVHSIGDGRISSIGRKGGYGKRVEIKHNGTYTTGYAHLSNFAKGLKQGDRVSQGQLIGYVGSTGLSSGPHLDFRVYKNGTPIDPLKMESPAATPINAQNKATFSTLVNTYNQILLAKY